MTALPLPGSSTTVPNSTGTMQRVTAAIRQAAKESGMDFDYLMRTARQESSFNPSLRASTSTATGLFQFLDQTWLATLHSEGAAAGYGRYAQAIERSPGGRYTVRDPALADEIMRLRFDPDANAAMGAAFTRLNRDAFVKALGREPTAGELYVTHFLGPSGGPRLIQMRETSPHTTAAAVFPQAAAANRPIFYTRDGTPRTVAEVVEVLVGRHQRPLAPDVVAAVAAVTGGGAPATPAAPQRVAAAPAPLAADDAAAQPRFPVVAPEADGTLFRSLFAPGRGQPVADVVAGLWGGFAGTATPPAAPQARPAPAARPAAGDPAPPAATPPPRPVAADRRPAREVMAFFPTSHTTFSQPAMAALPPVITAPPPAAPVPSAPATPPAAAAAAATATAPASPAARTPPLPAESPAQPHSRPAQRPAPSRGPLELARFHLPDVARAAAPVVTRPSPAPAAGTGPLDLSAYRTPDARRVR